MSAEQCRIPVYELESIRQHGLMQKMVEDPTGNPRALLRTSVSHARQQ